MSCSASSASSRSRSLLAGLLFGVTVKGSSAALALGALLYVFAGTALGILVSAFVRTQIAAIIATAIICTVPAINFSGYLYPAAALEGAGRYLGMGFPSLWFQNVSARRLRQGARLRELLSRVPRPARIRRRPISPLACLFLRKQETLISDALARQRVSPRAQGACEPSPATRCSRCSSSTRSRCRSTAIATGVKTDLVNASIAVVDSDRSPLSARIRDGLLRSVFPAPACGRSLRRRSPDGSRRLHLRARPPSPSRGRRVARTQCRPCSSTSMRPP